MDCSELVELSFLHSPCCQQGRAAYTNWFPRLSQLVIKYCPKLRSFPPVPWTDFPCSIEIQGNGSCPYVYGTSYSGYRLTIKGIDTGADSMFWNVLDFHNLIKLEDFQMQNCPPLPLYLLQMLSSLRKLWMSCSSVSFLLVKCESHAKLQLPVEELFISRWDATGKELTQLLSYFPKLTELQLWSYSMETMLGVMGQQPVATSRPSSSSNEVDHPDHHHQHHDAGADETESMLLLPPQLQSLDLTYCKNLSVFFNPHDDNNENGRTEPCRTLQALRSLRWLRIRDCPNHLSSYSTSSFASCFPFPNTLDYLNLFGAMGMETMAPLFNFGSLTTLYVERCKGLKGGGLLSLLAQGHLTKLSVSKSPNFFVHSEPSCVHGQELPFRSSKLQELLIDDVAGFTAAHIRRLLFSSLTKLEIYEDDVVKRFTKEEESLLFVNSLKKIKFNCCSRLQCLPVRLHELSNLKTLEISECEAIQMAPKNGFPSSLKELGIIKCQEIRSLPKECCLQSSLQKLVITRCPAIQSLPKLEDLPSSLQELDVQATGTEELRRQYCELIGIIPIVKT